MVLQLFFLVHSMLNVSKMLGWQELGGTEDAEREDGQLLRAITRQCELYNKVLLINARIKN